MHNLDQATRRSMRARLAALVMAAAAVLALGCEASKDAASEGQAESEATSAQATAAGAESPDESGAPGAGEAEAPELTAEQVKAWIGGLDDAARAELMAELGCAPQRADATDTAATDPAPTDAEPVRQTDVIHRKGSPLTLLGPTLEVGQEAPEFELVDLAMQPVRSTELGGAPLVVSVVPSLDTPVCEAQTGMLLSRLSEMPEGTKLVTVSRDLPFAQKRFVEHKKEAMEIPESSVIASDYDDGSFGRSWGLAVEESGLLARSVWVIGEDGRVAYREIVADQSTEPDYDALVSAAQAASGTDQP